MPFEPARIAAAGALVLALGGCVTTGAGAGMADNFGEANRQTMLAQVIDPLPEYPEGPEPSSAEHAAQAVDRYRKGTVKQPDKIQTSSAGVTGGGGSSSGGQ